MSGGVAGLAAADVAVVLIERPSGARAEEGPSLAHVGPIAVARTSARTLQAALGALLAQLVAVLAGMTLSLYARLSRARVAASVGSGGEGTGT